MSLPRLDHATHIADRLNDLAAKVKTRSRASLTDANRILETITARFLNAMFGWNLENLNALRANYPAADLGDSQQRIAIQVTNEDGSDKIKHTADKASEHKLGKDFDRLIIFFLLERKPGFPRKFVQPSNGPAIETWDISDLLKQMQELSDLKLLARAAKVLDEELGRIHEPAESGKYDISRILKYAPEKLIGRDDELKLLHDAWNGIPHSALPVPHPKVLTFVALGGEGKTSLVAKWAAGLAAQDWPGCDAAFAWSFYSQGTREQQAASSDLFLKEALTFFGDDQTANSAEHASEKGKKLAALLGQRRCLLILDGLEPLQYPTEAKAFKPGALKDDGIAKLMKGLATTSPGLCIVTTRIGLPDLEAFKGSTALEEKLERLSRHAGVDLLKRLSVKGSERRTIPLTDGDPKSELVNEFEKLVEDVKGHALTLTLLGGFLKRAFHGDIRQRDRVKFEKADEKMDGGHAFRVMAAYEKWLLRDGGEEGRREVAVLRLMGLFDRPADAGCLHALLQPPAIPDLTEPLVGLAEDDWEFCLSGLQNALLLTVNRDTAGSLLSLDAHPHIREFFAKQLHGQNPDAWREAHRLLYEHLCKHQEGHQPTLEDLQPLYQAIRHGVFGDRVNDAYEMYVNRIRRGTKSYALRKLGAVASDLSALACFVTSPWTTIDGRISSEKAGDILFFIGVRLSWLLRSKEAVEAFSTAVEIQSNNQSRRCAHTTRNLSEIYLARGELTKAIAFGEKAARSADSWSDHFVRAYAWAAWGFAYLTVGNREEAEAKFEKAKDIFSQSNHEFQPLGLCWTTGFWNAELKLGAVDLVFWKIHLGGQEGFETNDSAFATAAQIKSNAEAALPIMTGDNWLLDEGWNELLLAKVSWLSRLVTVGTLTGDELFRADNGIAKIRESGSRQVLPQALPIRACLRYFSGLKIGPDSAQSDLDEAWEVADRCDMKLFLADIHLHRARLFFREAKYPWESAKADLAAARKLIEQCGYGRRKEELEDAERALNP